MERKIRVISNELNNRKMKLEDKLEKLINSSEPIGEVQNEIIDVLREIAEINSTVDVWNNLLMEITKVNKPEENGTI